MRKPMPAKSAGGANPAKPVAAAFPPPSPTPPPPPLRARNAAMNDDNSIWTGINGRAKGFSLPSTSIVSEAFQTLLTHPRCAVCRHLRHHRLRLRLRLHQRRRRCCRRDGPAVQSQYAQTLPRAAPVAPAVLPRRCALDLTSPLQIKRRVAWVEQCRQHKLYLYISYINIQSMASHLPTALGIFLLLAFRSWTSAGEK